MPHILISNFDYYWLAWKSLDEIVNIFSVYFHHFSGGIGTQCNTFITSPIYNMWLYRTKQLLLWIAKFIRRRNLDELGQSEIFSTGKCSRRWFGQRRNLLRQSITIRFQWHHTWQVFVRSENGLVFVRWCWIEFIQLRCSASHKRLVGWNDRWFNKMDSRWNGRVGKCDLHLSGEGTSFYQRKSIYSAGEVSSGTMLHSV